MHRIKVVQGDITKLDVDAIVNAANEWMLGGGGVDGAIHRAAGPELLAACREVPELRPGVRCPTGEARITSGFRLTARYVIHTVGPIWRGGTHNEPQLLRQCYLNSLRIAVEAGLRTIAFPAISCGAYGYPLEAAANVAVDTISDFLTDNQSLDMVCLIAFEQDVFRALEASVEA
jgi:O-acetyl-ADP-ribose deacetylase